MKTAIQETELYKKFIKALDIHDMVADDNQFVVKCCKIAEEYANSVNPSLVPMDEEQIKPITDHDLLTLASGYAATSENMYANASSYAAGYRYAEKMLLAILSQPKEERKGENI